MNPYAEYQPPETSGQYFKFRPNQEHMIRLVSAEPYVYESHFEDPKTKETSVSTKYSWVIWNFEVHQEQILTLPVTGYKEVAKFGADPEFGDLRKRNLKVKRTGEGFDTKYAIVASPNTSELAEADPSSIGEVGKINLLGKLQGDDKIQFPMLLSEAIGNKKAGIDPKKGATTADELMTPQTPAEKQLANPTADTLPNDDDVDTSKPIDLSEIPF